jgi:phosphatidylserine/phosphatidylglycerophosphate/cardiolipin synthase-like enzyme
MLRRLLTAVLVAALLATLAPAQAWAAKYEPRTQAVFNNPWGSAAQKHRISTTVDKAIAAAPRGSTIRISQYAFSRRETAKEMIKAHRRGVNVRMVVNDHDVTSAIKRVRRVLGTDIHSRSFVVVCKAGCRSPRGGNHHSKFFTFTRLGSKEKVVMVGSGNLTHRGGGWQFNDHVVITGQRTLYAVFATVFDDMARDKPSKRPYWRVAKGRYTAEFLPAGRASADPVMRELDQVKCKRAAKGTGYKGRTVVRVSMWTWKGSRGMEIAKKLRRLDRRGCLVEVIVGAPSPGVLQQLRRLGKNGGVTVRDSRVDRNGDGEVDRAVHHKYILISGHFGNDRSAHRVMTGSLNMTSYALTNGDELVLTIEGEKIHRQYNRNFRWIWKNHARPLPNRPIA